jgi:hypothetical protein
MAGAATVGEIIDAAFPGLLGLIDGADPHGVPTARTPAC